MTDCSINAVKDLICRMWQSGTGAYSDSRYSHGIVICRESKFSFFYEGGVAQADSRHLLFLPKGSKYNFKCFASGLTYTYNFEGTLPKSHPYSVELSDNSIILSTANALQGIQSEYLKISGMYKIIGEALDGNVYRNAPKILHPALEYIHEGLENPDISCTLLASTVGISEVYLRKLFKEHLGTAPHEYVLKLRFERAKRLLSEGKNVSEAASLCGFSNLYYFSSAFKKRFGVSPSEFALSTVYM